MPEAWRSVRVFISSTFRDMQAERDHLVRFVFPELRERCRPLRVHVVDVDLRWGVTEKDAQDGKALDICLDEIDSCRPYFLGLLGHRYGWIPPGEDSSITAQEIYHGVLHNDLPRQVVDLHRLIEVPPSASPLKEEDREALVRCYPWDARKGRNVLAPTRSPADEARIRSVFSSSSSYQQDRSFFFLRAASLSESLAGPNRGDFFEADPRLEGRLEALRGEISASGLPVVEYAGVEELGERVLEVLWERIRREAGEGDDVSREPWEVEDEAHDRFIRDRTRRFVGRRAHLDSLLTFVEGDPGSALCMVTGEPGSGKSSLLARLVEECEHRHPDWLILPHFVGASAESTSVRRVLSRLCGRLGRSLPSSQDVPETLPDLIDLLPELLEEVARGRRVVLALDALNQLEATDRAHTLYWLPHSFPPNVRVVASTLGGEVAEALKRRKPPPVLLEVGGLGPEEARELVGSYLAEIRHAFPNPAVEDEFYRKIAPGNPLYIQVALEELRVFGQFEALGSRVRRLPETVPDLFGQVLERLEGDFSPGLIRDCLSFVALGRGGMAPAELQALLAEHAPARTDPQPRPKLPDMLWSRLRRAFGPYLFERSGLVDFFHGQLGEAVEHRYLTEPAVRKNGHARLARYFESRWREPYPRALSELPFQATAAEEWKELDRILTDLAFLEAKCAAGMTYDLVGDYERVSAGRLTAGAPVAALHRRRQQLVRSILEFRCPHCSGVFAGTMKESGRTRSCPGCSADVRLAPFTVDSPLAGPREGSGRARPTKASSPPTPLSPSMGEFADFVRENAHSFHRYHELVFTIAKNGSGERAPARVAEGVSEAGEHPGPWLKRLGDAAGEPPCLFTLEGGGMGPYASSPDGARLMGSFESASLLLWDAITGKQLARLEGHSERILSCAFFPDGQRALSASADGTLRVWDLTTLAEIGCQKGRRTHFQNPVILPDGETVVSHGADDTVQVWDPRSGACLRTIETGLSHDEGLVPLGTEGDVLVAGTIRSGDDRWASVRGWNVETGKRAAFVDLKNSGTLFAASVSPDGRLLATSCSSSDAFGARISSERQGTWIWRLPSGRPLRGLSEVERGSADIVAFSPDGRSIVTAHEDEVCLWRVGSGEKVWHQRPSGEAGGLVDRFTCIAFSPDGSLLAAGTQGATRVGPLVMLWNAATGANLATFAGHGRQVQTCSFSPDGRRIISTSEDSLRCWDAAHRCELPKEIPWVDHFEVSPRGSRVIGWDSFGAVSLWDGSCGAPIAELAETRNTNVGPKPYRTRDGHHVAFPAQQVVFRLEDGAAAKRGLLPELPFRREFFAGRWPPDRHALHPGGESLVGQVGEELGFFCMGENEPFAAVPVPGVDDCSYSPDGERVVWLGEDGRLHLLDTLAHREVAVMATRAGKLTLARASPDGRHLAAGDDQGYLHVWSLRDGSLQCRFPLGSPMTHLPSWGSRTETEWISWDLKARFLVVLDDKRHLHFFELMNVGEGTPRRTAVVVEGTAGNLAYRCPFCLEVVLAESTALETRVECPSCGESSFLNSFLGTAEAATTCLSEEDLFGPRPYELD
ncbi:MAG: DUF4062 domain-containing protein [Gemmatimonadota bacterium]